MMTLLHEGFNWITNIMTVVIIGIAFKDVIITRSRTTAILGGHTVPIDKLDRTWLHIHLISGSILLLACAYCTRVSGFKNPFWHKIIGRVAIGVSFLLFVPSILVLALDPITIYPMSTVGFQGYAFGLVNTLIALWYYGRKNPRLHALYGQSFNSMMQVFVRSKLFIHLASGLCTLLFGMTLSKSLLQVIFTLSLFTSTQVNRFTYQFTGIRGILISFAGNAVWFFVVQTLYAYEYHLLWKLVSVSTFAYQAYVHWVMFPRLIETKKQKHGQIPGTPVDERM